MIEKQRVKNEMAHPTGFEPVTSAFGARCLSAKYLILLAPNPSNPHEHIGNTTALSGNNPEAFRTRTDCFGDLFLVVRIVMSIVLQQCQNTRRQEV
jgi:hypothetical protein